MSRSHVSANLLVRALAVVGVAGLAGCAGETRTPPLKLPERPGLSGVSGHSGAPAPRGAAQETGTEVAERDNEIWVDRERASSLPPVLASDRTRPPLPGGLESGGFRTVGGLLAEGNGRAIYSDDVIATLTPELRGLAKNYDY